MHFFQKPFFFLPFLKFMSKWQAVSFHSLFVVFACNVYIKYIKGGVSDILQYAARATSIVVYGGAIK